MTPTVPSACASAPPVTPCTFAVHLHESMKLNADIREMRDSLDSLLSGNHLNQPEPEESEPEEE